MRDESTLQYSRREFVAKLAAAGFTVPLAGWIQGSNTKPVIPDKKNPVCIFSKHLQFLEYDAMAEMAAEIGFDGIDLAVRPGGHVLPERALEDLPRAVEAVQKAGLSVPMMTTAITTVDESHTEPILKTASNLGIGFYRMGYLSYDNDKGITDTLETYRSRLAKLAEINAKYRIHGAYQNHAGTRVGGPVWDLYLLLKGLDPQWIGVQYDIRHAVVEGGTSWPLGLRLVSPYVQITAIKDFIWTEREGRWQVENVPLQQGMVDFEAYFGIVKKEIINGPISLHFEYGLPGEDDESMDLSERRKKTTEIMRRDLVVLRNMQQEAGLD